MQREGKRIKTARTKQSGNLSLDSAFEFFCDTKVAEGRSKWTLETYEENYRYLCEFMKLRNIGRGLDNVTAEMIRDYVNYLLTEKPRWEGHRYKTEMSQTIGLDPVTINTRTKTLRTCLDF